MRIREERIPKALLILMLISLLIRGFLAAFHEFGNDEVYYWTYALYPDWSHFLHPGMVGWIMQLTSLNLLLDSEFFLRLSSVIFMTVNTWIIYLIGKEVKNKIAGFFAALLFSASFYAFVVTGVFILPDTPLMLFLLLSIYLFIRYFQSDKKQQHILLLAGLCAGLAMLSKYSGIFIWVGVALYILLYDRKELKNGYLYLALAISAICILPILIWNLQHDFISFKFHGDRVGLFGEPRPNYVGIELAGEILYNNPIVYALIIIGLIAFFRRKNAPEKNASRLLLLTALPWIGTFLYFSFTHPTLPHWSAPGFCLLIPIAANHLAEKQENMTGIYQIPKVITMALALLLIVVIVGSFEIKTGRIRACFIDNQTVEMTRVGEGDFTLDMYGWDKIREGFAEVRDSLVTAGEMQADDGIIALKWFHTANRDYYIATPLGLNLYAIGDLYQINKYYWINELRGGLQKGKDYWFINQSSNYTDPKYALLRSNFERVTPVDTFAVYRDGRVAEYIFVYKLERYKG